MKELVDHIRAIHFALAIASVVLLGASLRDTDRAVRQALTDAKLLRALAAETHPPEEQQNSFSPPSPLIHAINERAKQEFPQDEVFEPNVPSVSGDPREAPGGGTQQKQSHAAPGGSILPMVPESLAIGASPAHPHFKPYGPWLEVNPGKRIWASAFPGWLYIANHEPYSSDPAPLDVKLPEWKSLKDFVDYWDGEPVLAGIFPVGSEDAEDADGLENTPVSLECEDKRPRTFTLLNRPADAPREINYDVTRDAKNLKVKGRLGMDYQNCTVYFGVYRQVDVRDIIAARLQQLAITNPEKPSTEVEPIAAFHSTFHDLDALTAYTKALSWDDQISELDRQSRDSRPPIEIWGAKIPGWLGLVMLFGSQIYLLLHCIELRKLSEQTPGPLPTGYVGLYRQFAAQALSTVTLILLPAAAVYFVLANDRRQMWFRIVLAAVSALLGSAAVYQLNRLSATTRPELIPNTVEQVEQTNA